MDSQKLLVREFNKLKAVSQLTFGIPGMSAKIEIDPILHQGGDHIPFASNKGQFRTLRLRYTSDPEEETGRIFRIYYGPWRTTKDHYIILTRGQDILAELGFTSTSHSIRFSKNSILVRHRVLFSRRKSSKNHALAVQATRRAKKLGLNLDEGNSIVLRKIDLKRASSVPSSDLEVMKRFILSGLAKRAELWTAGQKRTANQAGTTRGKNSADAEAWPGAANPKYKTKMVKFEVNIEKKAQNHKRHQAIINLIKRELESQGYSCNATPEDLRAENHKAKWIFEVKAWDPDLEVSAIWHAFGQVNWYCFKKPRYKPAIVLAHQPGVELVKFVEDECKVPLLWAQNCNLTGGRLAKKHFSL